MVFCLVVSGVYPPYTLSGPTTKKNTFFMCVFPKRVGVSRKYRADMKGIHRFFFGFGYRNKKKKKYCFGCNMIHSLKQVFLGKEWDGNNGMHGSCTLFEGNTFESRLLNKRRVKKLFLPVTMSKGIFNLTPPPLPRPTSRVGIHPPTVLSGHFFVHFYIAWKR